MIEFLKAGGIPVVFVLLFSVVTVGAGALYSFAPNERRLGFVRAMTATTLFSVLTAVAANLAAVFHKVPNTPEWAESPDMPLIVMVGIGEAITPAILGFAALSISWLMMSVGIRRL
ncbi:MAG: hypothetical protein KJO07_19650 [Deltaproteobacteria bacterium]|jgi:hypothetical protein|nr:hypothetical protein [Deltaproteobacteria bacterium]